MSVTKAAQPVLGFNHNLKFGPRVYHVQTEDSGLPHAHYITHLFVGGNILASMKTSYADRANEPDLAKTVRSLMEAQHKQMVKRLVAGEFNDRAQLFSASYEPGVLATGQHGPAAMNQARSEPTSAVSMSTRPLTTPAGGLPKVTAPPPPVRAPAPQPTAHASQPQPTAPNLSRPPPPNPSRPPPPNLSRPPPPNLSRPATPPRPPPTASAVSSAPRPQTQTPAASPPPAARPSAAPTVIAPVRLPGSPLPPTTRTPPPPTRPTPPPMVPMVAPVARQPAPPPRTSFSDPYPVEKPVEMPFEGLPTIFAEELISEKSLDEVILAFLSADLEQGK